MEAPDHPLASGRVSRRISVTRAPCLFGLRPETPLLLASFGLKICGDFASTWLLTRPLVAWCFKGTSKQTILGNGEIPSWRDARLQRIQVLSSTDLEPPWKGAIKPSLWSGLSPQLQVSTRDALITPAPSTPNGRRVLGWCWRGVWGPGW